MRRANTSQTLHRLSRETVKLVAVTGVVGLSATLLGQHSISLYIVCGVTFCLITAAVQKELLQPHFADIHERIRRIALRCEHFYSPSRPIRVLLTFVAGPVVGTLGYFFGQRGLIALLAVVAVLIIGLGFVVTQPLLHALLRTADPQSTHANAQTIVGVGPSRQSTQRSPVLRTGIVTTGVVVGVLTSGVVAFFAAGLGLKGVVASLGLVAVGIALTWVKDRTTFLMFGSVASLALVLHKSFGPISFHVASGAVSVSVTTFDLMVVLCYLSWLAEGTLATDLRAAFVGHTRRILQMPLWCSLALLPSLLVAANLTLSVSEIVRMMWMYLLFVFVAVRVRSARHVWAILSGLGVLAVVEVVVVVLQWKTGGVLGLSFLGVPKELGERVTNDGSLGRPFGTIIHPVFMGAAMGSLGAVALGLACTVRRSLLQRTCLVMVPLCALPLYLSHARASLVAFAIAATAEVLWCVHRKWVPPQALRIAVAGVLFIGVMFAPRISAKFSENFGTAHYNEEVQSRLELNDVAGEMIADNPIIGVGLNNFQEVMGPYQQYGLIFADNPVHNLYLLTLSETGVIGFIGVSILGVSVYALAMRLARSRDPLHAGIGVGSTGVIGFLMVEEILGFSLRQDIPLALFWLLIGLCVSCTNQGIAARTLDLRKPRGDREGHVRRDPLRPKKQRSTRRLASRRSVSRRRLGLAGALSVGLFASVALTTTANGAQRYSSGIGAGWKNSFLLMSATDRSTGRTGIYTLAPGATDPRLISPDDGRVYSWPSWSPDARKIVYTVRKGEPGAVEEVEVMNPDGSGAQTVTDLGIRTGQPKFSDDQRSILFSGLSPNFERVALYSIDVDTLVVTNLSARSRPVAAVDADPRFVSDGRIVFSEVVGVGAGSGETINLMDADGRNRRVVVDDKFFNTDVDVAPDTKRLATASFRGGGDPQIGGKLGDSQLRLTDWHLVVHTLKPKGGTTEKVLTGGADCTTRTLDNRCGLTEGSGFTPRWSVDGRYIAYETPLDSQTLCICVVSADGTSSAIRFTSTKLAINWFDWTERKPQSTGSLIPFGVHKRTDRMLITAEDRNGERLLLEARPDLSRWETLGIDSKIYGSIRPEQASWSLQRDRAVFSARVPTPSKEQSPHPAPPHGSMRSEHFVLDDLSPPVNASSPDKSLAETQIFLRDARGSVRQLTDAFTEDWRDGHKRGDLFGNRDPKLTADGAYVVYTSVSSVTGQSAVMSLNIATGEVLNLSNASSGAMPTTDKRPAVSPDGQAVVFVASIGGASEVVVANVDGSSLQQVTNDDWFDVNPAWSPDGKSIVFASFRGRHESLFPQGAEARKLSTELDTKQWSIIRVDGPFSTNANRKSTVATDYKNKSRILAAHIDGPTVDPSWSPDGSQIVFTGKGRSSVDLYWVPAVRAERASEPLPEAIAVTPYINELHVDWK
jgi:Tol biopolymer transport system component/O-antigen ligase